MRYFIIALLVVLGFLPGTAQQIPEEQKPSYHYTPSNPSVQETNTEPNKRTGEKENGEDDSSWLLKFVDRHDNVINALSTFVIAIFTIALFMSTHSLWKSGEKHSERELRAYVFPVSFTIRNFQTTLSSRNSAPQRISAYVKIKNTGQTPAYKFTCQVKMTAGPFPQTNFTISEEDAEHTPGNLGPEGAVSYTPTKDTLLTREQAKDVIAGKWAIYVFGRIDYVDAFKIPRWTTFRTLARGDHGVMFTAKEGEEDVLLLTTHEDGNDAT